MVDTPSSPISLERPTKLFSQSREFSKRIANTGREDLGECVRCCEFKSQPFGVELELGMGRLMRAIERQCMGYSREASVIGRLLL